MEVRILLVVYRLPYLLTFFFRRKLVEIVMAIHERGIQHNDLFPRNFVVDNIKSPSRIVIIDFDYSTPHECERDLDIALYMHPPYPADFGCLELYRIARLMEIWTPGECMLLLCMSQNMPLISPCSSQNRIHRWLCHSNWRQGARRFTQAGSPSYWAL